MPGAVISIGERTAGASRQAVWSLLEVARPGTRPVPFGILLADESGNPAEMRFRDLSCFDELVEDEIDVLELLPGDLAAKGRETSGLDLIEALEGSLSHFLRISDRTSVAYSGDAQATVNRLFEEHVDPTVRPHITHLPLYGLRAAATKFGEYMDAAEEGWVLAPENLRLSEGMFVAHVVGRSMEPRIPDGSLCIFRAPVVGSRYGRLLLIEMLDVDDNSQRYTVKKYARTGDLAEGADREQSIRLEPLNREFDTFELDSDRFRVVAEFVQVLRS
jgi:SOS-response transcriptional repressor LexA